MRGKMEARADLASDKLTTSTGYNRKAEFLDNFAGLPACSGGQQKIGKPEAQKEVILSGKCTKIQVAGGDWRSTGLFQHRMKG